jgi:hypothetical protein
MALAFSRGDCNRLFGGLGARSWMGRLPMLRKATCTKMLDLLASTYIEIIKVRMLSAGKCRDN